MIAKGVPVRLPEFIQANLESILAEWETFARSIPPGAQMDQLALRDHAEAILQATALDMMSAQSSAQQSDKSQGRALASDQNVDLNSASEVHAIGRVLSGFDLIQVVSEYRALRASVIQLWRRSGPDSDLSDLDDLTRFNESIDQSLTKAVRGYTERVGRSRQMFLAILGHDLRNPLNSMTLSAELLAHSCQLDADCTEVAAQISTSATAMGRIISDLLDFTSTGLGATMPLSPSAMDLGLLGDEVIREMRAAHPNCELRFQATGDLAGAWDSARLRQLLSNLLGNAIQHGALDGPVALSLNGEGPEILLTVHNGGTPIPPDAVATIFDPLVRGASPELQKQSRPGSIGLGLYIAREVVTAHGGRISVTSSAPSGTAFTVHLPRHPRHGC